MKLFCIGNPLLDIAAEVDQVTCPFKRVAYRAFQAFVLQGALVNSAFFWECFPQGASHPGAIRGV